MDNRAWPLLLLVLLAPAVAALNPDATNYVAFSPTIEEKYRHDEDVVLRFSVFHHDQGREARGPVSVRLLDSAGAEVPVNGGQDWLKAGVEQNKKYYVNLGRLDVGRYLLTLQGTHGGVVGEHLVDIRVIFNPIGYKAWMAPIEGGVEFFLQGAEDQVFEVEAYEVLGNTKIPLTTQSGSRIQLPFPYRGAPIYVDVVGPHGWTNYEHVINGERGLPWRWEPDEDREYTENYQIEKQENKISGAVIMGGFGFLALVGYVYDRRKRGEA